MVVLAASSEEELVEWMVTLCEAQLEREVRVGMGRGRRGGERGREGGKEGRGVEGGGEWEREGGR